MLKTALSVFFVLTLASPAFSIVYKYVDKNGVVCYTDTPLTEKSEVVNVGPSDDQDTTVRHESSATVSEYSAYVARVASKYDLEPGLIKAVIRTESNGDRRAVSSKGAMGLMQLMPQTADDMNVSNPFDAEENIEGGAKYLKFLLQKFDGDLTLALAAYNAGPNAVEKYGGVPPIPETRRYVKKVLALYKGKTYINSGYGRKIRTSSMPIYKVVLADGTTLFTNSSLATADRTRF